jgi:ubiquinone/menaquinone biosynthesis C-methylase UbiE
MKNLYQTIYGFVNPYLLRINYQKISEPNMSGAGYVDIEAVAKRYNKVNEDIGKSELLKNSAVRDAVYFLEKDCIDHSEDFRKVGKVLDIGCGTGIYSKIFRKINIFGNNFKYIGTEINQIFVDICKKKNPKENFVVSYADKINFKDNYFDLVYCSSTIHYTLNKWKESLNEMARISNKFVVMVRFPLTKFNKTFYVHQRVSSLDGVENHYFIVVNRNDFEKYLEKIGLQIIKRDYSSEEYIIDGVGEKIILTQYLLKKVGSKK